MSAVVYKYALSPATPVLVEMPRFAHIVHVGSQDDGPVLWAEVETGQPPEKRTFYVYGTGHFLDGTLPLKHIGTCQTDSGFVWHVYELPVERNIGELLMEMAGQT